MLRVLSAARRPINTWGDVRREWQFLCARMPELGLRPRTTKELQNRLDWLQIRDRRRQTKLLFGQAELLQQRAILQMDSGPDEDISSDRDAAHLHDGIAEEDFEDVNGQYYELDEVEVEVELEEEGPCFGCCLGGEVTLIGTARDRPDPSEPDGGWGYTPCCRHATHFDCLGRWLTPDDPDHGRLVESTSGLVAIELKCPFCKKALSRSRTRMLRA